MLGILNKMKEDFYVQKQDGSTKGPYQASFIGTVITVSDIKANIQKGDIIIRKLPNGNDDLYYITEVTCYPRPFGGIPPHYQVKITKTPPAPQSERSVQNISIHGSQSIQIGDHNVQHITNTFNELIQKIDSSSASEAEKQQAKSLLNQFLSHPLVVSILGSAVSAGIGLL
ncbi:RIP homotypic interaction motif-containing protein [Aggregatibacter actinomycetemcomitans]|uniref:RIP homotypic interaction motif-containing protein n=1 Tax=Aggregatibacter actinomycetemcomitans TaxID=714 RepID=UPI001E3CD39F|nr:RIP homotypic interaction motif-containing protein [Aggregatibacter actinomycetemcomitans]